jgi:hypothetical protein
MSAKVIFISIFIIISIISIYSAVISSLLAFTNMFRSNDIINIDDSTKKIFVKYSTNEDGKDKLCLTSSITNKTICLDNDLNIVL